MDAQNFIAVIECPAKAGLGGIELTPHVHILRALPWKEEGDLRRGLPLLAAADRDGTAVALGLTQLCARRRQIRRDDAAPVGQVGAARRGGITNISQTRLWAAHNFL